MGHIGSIETHFFYFLTSALFVLEVVKSKREERGHPQMKRKASREQRDEDGGVVGRPVAKRKGTITQA